jgi:glycosyltransferase involved in cell wall biosynthesis
MKVLMTTDNIGGVWTYALAMARGLKKHGVEVVLAVIGNPLTPAQKDELNGIRYRHCVARQEWMDDPWENVYATGKWLMNFRDIENPDILHLNSYTLGCLDWQVPVVVTLHSCVLSWWQAVKGEPAPASWNTYHEHVKAGIQSAGVVTAPSRFIMNAAEKFYGPFRYKKLIYNGIDHSHFKRGRKEKIVFSMGRIWDEAKNISLLLKAAEKIPWPVYIAGEHNGMDENHLPANVTLLGQLSQKEVAGWLSKAWLYVLPAKYEPFGYTFLEAALSGCVLVGGDIESLHEIWNDKMIYATTDDPQYLADTVTKLFENEWQLNYLSRKTHEHALATYTEDIMLKEYTELYKSLEKIKLKITQH